MTYVYQGRIERRWRVMLGTEVEVNLWLWHDVEHQLKLDWRFGETYLWKSWIAMLEDWWSYERVRYDNTDL